jgi:predicted secreted hydrolase|nr:hypothetical protein [Kofleriaceae bacterium]
MTVADNLRRGRPGTYEVWYATWNDPRTGDGFWLRYVIESHANAGRAAAPEAVRSEIEPDYAEVWFARFCAADPAKTFGVHQRFATATSHDAPFEIAIGDSTLRHDGARGSLRARGHDVTWDLAWQAGDRTLRLFPDLAYRLGIGETTVLSPNPQVAARGTIVVDGERYELAGAPLGQTHLWGTRHAYSWAWAHCAFESGELLELLAVCLNRGGVMTPPLVMVRFGDHALNQFRHVALNRASWDAGRVTFTARGATVKLEGELTCAPSQLIVAPYLDPDGTEVFCANTEIGDARIVESRRDVLGTRWHVHRTHTSAGRAHFEAGGRTRFATVTREHELADAR